MTRFRFVLDRAGVEKVSRSPEMGAFVGRNADRVADHARRGAPVDSGAYRSSITSGAAQPSPTGWSAPVGSTDPFWHLIEFGSINNPAHRVLSRAVSSAGLRFEEAAP